MREFIILFVVQFFQYFIATFNIRACAQANYMATLTTDLLLAGNSFFIIKRVAESKSKYGVVGYILGGALGSQAGILASLFIFHK